MTVPSAAGATGSLIDLARSPEPAVSRVAA